MRRPHKKTGAPCQAWSPGLNLPDIRFSYEFFCCRGGGDINEESRNKPFRHPYEASAGVMQPCFHQERASVVNLKDSVEEQRFLTMKHTVAPPFHGRGGCGHSMFRTYNVPQIFSCVNSQTEYSGSFIRVIFRCAERVSSLLVCARANRRSENRPLPIS